jgi:uncharacterized membrane protein YphA (DoxX/SURF4 family)
MMRTSRVSRNRQRSSNLFHLYCSFPRGSAAIGLFLLRAMVGVTAIASSALYFSRPMANPENLAAGSVYAISGALAVIGLWTPAASAVFALAEIVTWALWAGSMADRSIHSTWMTFYGTAIAIALLLLGPGALSLDYCLFGPREIVIPATNLAADRCKTAGLTGAVRART